MVYCPKCGNKNPDDTRVCAQCGASLYPIREERERHYRRYENECFGIPRGGAVVGMAIGIIIVLGGLVWLLQQAELIPRSVEVWPFALMIFGILILVGALYGLRRRY